MAAVQNDICFTRQGTQFGQSNALAFETIDDYIMPIKRNTAEIHESKGCQL
ncbi:MAG: hypothetical protein Q4E54_02620 [Lachnospiraceae bacterium]|nr:hypothetical protein [Lachnospiraceae bacterium]